MAKKQEDDADEPSMEEILTSIRRIIADEDDGDDAEAKAAGDDDGPDDDDDDVLELTRALDDDDTPEVASNDEAEVSDDGDLDDMDGEIELAPIEASADADKEGDMASKPPSTQQGLVSDTAAEASSGAFAKLTTTLTPDPPPLPDSGRSMEQVVADMIRPMLKQWLDDNLPEIVERLVEQEITKIARRSEIR